MTTIGGTNIYNIAVKGSFDDCQKIVKELFNDNNFRAEINMSGVNSINWARIVCQIVYYFYSYFKLKKDNISFSVPTGNFGDIYAGYVAKKMGLPINKLIVATNENDILQRVINTGEYKPDKVKSSISPSMDIQVASNFERLIYELNNHSGIETEKVMKEIKKTGQYKIPKDKIEKIKKDFLSASLNEEEMKDIISKLSSSRNPIIVDPHTAIGIGAIVKILNSNKDRDFNINSTISLATAHPAKFPEATSAAHGAAELSEELKHIMKKKENFDIIQNDIEKVKNYILKKI